MASNDTPKTVLLKGDPLPGEAVAAGAIVPGEAIVWTAASKVQRKGADGDRPLMIAREADFTGGSIDTAYALDDQVPFYIAQPGDEYYAIAGAAVAVGANLSAAANGRFVTTVAGPVLAVALTAAAANGDRIRIRAA